MMKTKPLGKKSYGHIPHLQESRIGPGDHKVHIGQANIATVKVRDKHDEVIVTEKLDGSNVCIANVDGEIIPITRAGYHCKDSHYRQHHMFARYVHERQSQFNFLYNGERLVGEWLAMAHGTRYNLKHDPFVAFDLMIGAERSSYDDFLYHTADNAIVTAKLIHRGGAVSVDNVMERIGRHGFHGAIDPVEGAVWRVEMNGKFDFMAKYVRPDKRDGSYIFNEDETKIPDNQLTWNWKP